MLYPKRKSIEKDFHPITFYNIFQHLDSGEVKCMQGPKTKPGIKGLKERLIINNNRKKIGNWEKQMHPLSHWSKFNRQLKARLFYILVNGKGDIFMPEILL